MIQRFAIREIGSDITEVAAFFKMLENIEKVAQWEIDKRSDYYPKNIPSTESRESLEDYIVSEVLDDLSFESQLDAANRLKEKLISFATSSKGFHVKEGIVWGTYPVFNRVIQSGVFTIVLSCSLAWDHTAGK